MPDQRLKDAMEEIKPLLKKYDCAAIVLLSSEKNKEFFYELSPTWSCARFTGEGALRIKALAADFPSNAAQKKTVEATAGIFLGFIDLLDRAKRDMRTVAEMLGSKFDISHWTRDETK